MPIDLKPRVLSTMITEDDSTASLHLAMEVAGYFDLNVSRARTIAAEVAQSISMWRKEAARHGLSKTEIDRMASAFEHDDLKQALGK
jgi:serine/threonine-protein kinase HipA